MNLLLINMNKKLLKNWHAGFYANSFSSLTLHFIYLFIAWHLILIHLILNEAMNLTSLTKLFRFFFILQKSI